MKTQSTYNTQATDFLARNGLKIAIKLSNKKPVPWEPCGNHYCVTLSRAAREQVRTYRGEDGAMKVGPFQYAAQRLTFDFWGSQRDKAKLHVALEDLQNMQLQIQNTEPHLRINLRELLAEHEASVAMCHPTPYDVLACISSDVHCPETFADFCAEYGSDEDRRKAEQTFRRASAFARKLRTFFTDAEQEELSEIQ